MWSLYIKTFRINWVFDAFFPNFVSSGYDSDSKYGRSSNQSRDLQPELVATDRRRKSGDKSSSLVRSTESNGSVSEVIKNNGNKRDGICLTDEGDDEKTKDGKPPNSVWYEYGCV